MNLNVNGQLPHNLRDDSDAASASNAMSIIGELSRLINNKILSGEEKNPLLQKSARLIMMELAHKDQVTQLDLVKATHLKAPTVSITLQKLEKEGYVERKPDSYDLRAIRVFLTEKGSAYNKYIVKRVRDIENNALSCLSDNETKQLVRILLKLKDNIIEDNEKNKY